MNINKIKEFLNTQGIFLISTTKFDANKFKTNNISNNILNRSKYAISLLTPIPEPIFLTITNSPSLIYKTYYKLANNILNETAFKLCQFIQENGNFAFPIPASQFTNWKTEQAHISHIQIAVEAGLGWVGKHNLLINEKYGPAIRITTILTDIIFDNNIIKLTGNCGNCKACIEQCPANAISNNNYNRELCSEKLKEFGKKKVGVRICGVCIRSCLETKKYKRNE